MHFGTITVLLIGYITVANVTAVASANVTISNDTCVLVDIKFQCPRNPSDFVRTQLDWWCVPLTSKKIYIGEKGEHRCIRLFLKTFCFSPEGKCDILAPCNCKILAPTTVTDDNLCMYFVLLFVSIMCILISLGDN